jgi:TfdA family taurine catabolism dioxygenase TauD
VFSMTQLPGSSQAAQSQLLASLPEPGRVETSSALARELRKAAERLPHYDNKEFYAPALQSYVRDKVRQACPDGFDWLINQIKERIVQWPYCVLVEGLSFDEGNRLFVAINRAFGELVARPYEKPRAQLVHYIQPATDLRSARGGQETERMHTDTADWDPPVELISMACVRPDPKGGGRSRVLDVETVRDEVKKHLGISTLELLENQPVPWQLAPYCGGGVKWRPVLTGSSICWRRYTIDLALNFEGASLSEEMLTALEAFENVITATTRTADFLMREGDLLFSDNTRTIHSRTPILDGDASDRLMIRSWIRTS